MGAIRDDMFYKMAAFAMKHQVWEFEKLFSERKNFFETKFVSIFDDGNFFVGRSDSCFDSQAFLSS